MSPDTTASDPYLRSEAENEISMANYWFEPETVSIEVGGRTMTIETYLEPASLGP